MTQPSYERLGVFYLGREYDPATQHLGAELLEAQRVADGALLLTFLAVLCLLRGWYLRTQAAIVRRTFAYATGVEQEMARRDQS